MQIDYIALRSLKGGHVVDTLYTINVNLVVEDLNRETKGAQVKMLDGTTVTTIHNRELRYRLETIRVSDITVPDNDDMIEFLDSVMSGEVFQLDLSGTLENYILTGISRPYTRTRISTSSEFFRYTFSVRKL